MIYKFWIKTHRSTNQLVDLIKTLVKEGGVFEALVNTWVQNNIDDHNNMDDKESRFSLVASATDPTNNMTLVFTNHAKIAAGVGAAKYDEYLKEYLVGVSGSASLYRLFDVIFYINKNFTKSAGFYCTVHKNTPVFDVVTFTVDHDAKTFTVHALQTTVGQKHKFNAALWKTFRSILHQVITKNEGYEQFTLISHYTYVLHSDVQLTRQHLTPTDEQRRTIVVKEEDLFESPNSKRGASRFIDNLDASD
jgi:hypothetical protein